MGELLSQRRTMVIQQSQHLMSQICATAPIFLVSLTHHLIIMEQRRYETDRPYFPAVAEQAGPPAL